MRTVNVEDAIGHVLCHDLTRIVKDQMKGAEFRKGHIIQKEDIPVLLAMGKERVFVWEKPTGFLHEDEAAEELDVLCRGKHIGRRGPVEGKIEHFSEIDGLFRVDTDRLEQINALDELIIATRHDFSPVTKGSLLAGMKAIPLVIAEEKLHAARAIADDTPLLNVLPYTLKSAAIVTTGSEIAKGRIEDTFTPVIKEKLRGFGIEITAREVTGDGIEDIVCAIERLRAVNPDLILCTGGMSVDPDDCTPGAIKRVIAADGGSLVSYGAPVMPGAMFLLAYLKNGVPLLGLPGCVMFAKATIFDMVLPRLAADVIMNKKDFIAMGHGGLCLTEKTCKPCHFPNCAFGK